jgi:hypothetical protein
MGYLICEKCGGHYQLKEGESPEDFENCQCGGRLKYVDSIKEYLDEGKYLTKNTTCPQCGAATPVYGNFCMKCGKTLKNVEKHCK